MYYTGSPSNLGRVSCTQYQDFPSFARRAFTPKKIALTRGDFLALPEKEKDAVKRVQYYTPCAFKTKEGARRLENATVFYLICLDIDGGEDASRLYENALEAGAALEPWAHVIHTTAKSTPEKPRLRIVVSADGIPVSRYLDALALVADRLGIGAANKESRVVVQPMFRPVSFSDDTFEDHPVLVAHYEGGAVKEEDLPFTVAEPADECGSFGYLKPKTELSSEHVAHMLDSLDPDCARGTWVVVGAGLKHQFGEEGFDLWDNWSQGGDKYPGLADMQSQWKSLRENPSREAVTIRSVMHLAREAGWEDRALADQEFNSLKNWINAVDRSALFAEAPKKIAESPVLSHLERKRLIVHLADVMRGKGEKLAVSDLKKAVQLEKQKLMADADLPKWAKDWVYVARWNEFFKLGSEVGRPPEVLNSLYSRELMTEDEENRAKPSMMPTDYLLNVVKVSRIEGYAYRPDNPSQFVREGKGRYANTYQKPNYELDEKGAAAAAAVLKEHLELLVEEPAYREILLDWMAFQIQHPGKKILWAVLMQSAQGAGKSLLYALMESLLGIQNTAVLEATTLLESPFSSWATGNQLVCVEELYPTTHARNEAAERLKSYITGERVEVHMKGKEPYLVTNVTNYLLLTNHVDAVRLSPSERRYFVIHSRLQTKEQVEKVPMDHYKRFIEEVVKKPGAVASWLKRRDLSAFDPNSVVRTKYFFDTCEAGRSSLDLSIEAAIADSSRFVTEGCVSLTHLKEKLRLDGGGKAGLSGVMAVLRQQGYISRGQVRYKGERVALWMKKGDTREAKDVLAGADISDFDEERA